MHRTEMLPLLRLQLVLLRAVAWRRAEAQASLPPTSVSPSPGNYSVKINPALASVLIAFICGFFLLGFFSVYLRRCAEDSDVVAARDGAGFVDGEAVAGGRRRRGLDREVLETLPTMAYAKAKELRAGKEAMECAVCLSEFSDEDILRVLPGCCHVFHVDCVDVWLESHVTCPVCRANLSDPAVPAADSRTPAEATAGNEDSTEEEAEGVRHGNDDMEAGLGGETATGAPEDRHTLRLPEHVRREILEAGRLRRAASLTVPSGGEASGRRGYRADAGAGRSGRWGFLLRTFSVRRRPEVAPVPARSASSSKRIFPSDGAPSSVTVGDGGAECKSGSDKKDEVSLSEPAEERV